MSDVINRDPRLDDDADLAKAKKWRNLWFLKDGDSKFGSKEFDDQMGAETMGDRTLKTLRIPGIVFFWKGR